MVENTMMHLMGVSVEPLYLAEIVPLAGAYVVCLMVGLAQVAQFLKNRSDF